MPEDRPFNLSPSDRTKMNYRGTEGGCEECKFCAFTYHGFICQKLDKPHMIDSGMVCDFFDQR